MEGKTYGYMRVSAKDQNADRQRLALLANGVREKDIYLDRLSGKDFNRPEYQRLMKRLRPSDTIVIESIDRLGRNYGEILEEWRMITKKKEASIVVLDMPLLNTQNDRDLTGVLISDIVLQLLSYVAEKEREYIRSRQAEGIAAAKLRGVKFGRSPKKIPAEFFSVFTEWKTGKVSAREAGRRLGVSYHTFLNWAGMKNDIKK